MVSQKLVWVSIGFSFHSLAKGSILYAIVWLAAMSLQLSSVFTQWSLAELKISSTWLLGKL